MDFLLDALGEVAGEVFGSVVSYLQLAHNERHPVTGTSTAKVIHNFGRAETVDRDALDEERRHCA